MQKPLVDALVDKPERKNTRTTDHANNATQVGKMFGAGQFGHRSRKRVHGDKADSAENSSAPSGANRPNLALRFVEVAFEGSQMRIDRDLL